MVYVLNIEGQPIMSTERHGKVRRMLKNGTAKVVRVVPFTIQLLYEVENITQDITLGVDIGSQIIGLSATTETVEVFSAEVIQRQDVSELMLERKTLRRNRRSRLKRRRKARFNNRRRAIGWLTPTVRQKKEVHIRVIKFIQKILPITKVVLEMCMFDMQKINNPNISGVEYQRGEQYSFENVKSFVRARDGYTCQYCGKQFNKLNNTNDILEVHHIVFRTNKGSDKPSNLISLCKKCHKDLHEDKIKLSKVKNESYRDASHVNSMSESLYNDLIDTGLNVEKTYGYITKGIRIDNEIEKSHINDAVIISGNYKAKRLHKTYNMIPIRRHFRQLQKANKIKGGKIVSQRHHKLIHGFGLYDLIKYGNKLGYISKLRESGSFGIRGLDGKVIKDGITFRKLKLVQRTKGFRVG